MHRSKFLGYVAYPFLALIFLFAPETVAISPTPLMAQSTTPAAVPPAPADAPASQEPAPSSSSQQAAPLQSGTSAQGAAARIRLRRQQRIAQATREIYEHKYEAFGGAGFVRFQPGPSLQKANELSWDAAITDYLKPKLGVTVDFRGFYGTAYTYNNSVVHAYLPSIYQYTAMAGPQYRVYSGPHYAVGARVLGGVSYGNYDNSYGGEPPSTYIGLYPDGSALALNVGVPVDYNVSPALGLRLTPEYFVTRFGGEFQRHRGLTLGVIYRFGKP